MNRLCDYPKIVDVDTEDAEDPEQLLNEWLGELDNLTGGLDPISPGTCLKPLNPEITAPRIDRYRFSMANLEDSQDVDLDAILGELCALETVCEREINQAKSNKQSIGGHTMSQYETRTHDRSLSETSRITTDDGSIFKGESGRTDSPDNDSAFSDTVSMLSSESSASSGGSGTKPQSLRLQNIQQDEASRIKAEKIRMAMEKIKEANVQKLFLKVFTADESAKSLLVDEKMACSYVTRMLADKNHVQMDPKWAVVEHLPELYMERFYEDHELLVDNLLLWTRDSKNKIYFLEREDKIKLFLQPEVYLFPSTDKKQTSDFDEHSRNMLLEEYFSATSVPEVEGPLYLKADSKKGWKKYHFVLRSSGLYYFPKEKMKSAKDLVCLATFDNNHIYYGLGWKKKYKAPSDYCFAIKHPRLQEPKSTKFIKYLCAEDQNTLDRWIIGMRIAKFGKQLMENYRSLIDELAQEDLDILAHARSCSVSSIAVQSFTSNVTTPTQGYPISEAGYGTQSETYSAPSEFSSSSGRHSRASSSSSSGCMSDGASSTCENAFDSEFPMGTIKRKPSMKPSLPLTSITRQLKEVGETRDETDSPALPSSPVLYTSTGTLTRSHTRRKSTNLIDESPSTGTLKRQHSYKSSVSMESMGSKNGSSSPLCSTPVRERSSPFGDRNVSFINRSVSSETMTGTISPPTNEEVPSCMTDSFMSLPPPPEPVSDGISNSLSSYQLPPPPPELFNSNLSLDSLPPPPNPSELPPITGTELTGSQLSLMSLPPPPGEVDSGTIRRTDSPLFLGGKIKLPMSPDQTPTQSRLNSPVCSSPMSHEGSNCSTPIQTNSPVSLSPTMRSSYAQNNQIHGFIAQNHDRRESGSTPYSNPPPPQYRPNNTLPNNNVPFNNPVLRSSLRQGSLPRQISSNSINSTTSSLSSSKSSNSGCDSPNSSIIQKKTCFQEPTSPKKNKKISFKDAPPLPKKPPPPKRAETTKLSSPKKLADPPMEFLKDLQRVMRKKWQVAQKCKLEPDVTPHEVLGFRDPPALLPSYKEHNVSNWVQEHYGPNNVYENVYRDAPDVVEYAASAAVQVRNDQVRSGEFKVKRPPPPPPPKRSEKTTLSTPKSH